MLDELDNHIVALRRYAYLLCRNPSDADDLVQESLVKAIAAAGSYQPGKSLRAWLFSILHNTFVSHRRQFARRARAAAFLESLETAPADSTPEQERYVEVQHTLNLFARLSDDQRTALMLIAVDGLSYEEAADILNIPVGTLMSRLARGRERLRRLMENEEPVTSVTAELKRCLQKN